MGATTIPQLEDRSESVNRNCVVSDEPPTADEWIAKHVTEH
jgi:hypothetical protein